MTVEVVNMQGSVGAGGAAIYDFDDDFSVNRVFQLYHNLTGFDAPGGLEYNIVLGEFLIFGGSTSSATGILCTGAPNLQGQANQFIRITLNNPPQLLTRFGPAVKVSGMGFLGVGQSNMYACHMHVFTGTLNLLGVFPSAVTNQYVIAAGIGAPAQFDIFELEVQCGLVSNRVRCWQNGTLLADILDADANRVVPAYGYPGWAGGGSGTAVSTEWDNLSVRRLRP